MNRCRALYKTRKIRVVVVYSRNLFIVWDINMSVSIKRFNLYTLFELATHMRNAFPPVESLLMEIKLSK